MMKAVILDADTVTGGDVSLESITSLAETEVYGFSDDENIVERIKDASIVLTNKCRITRSVMEKCPYWRFRDRLQQHRH